MNGPGHYIGKAIGELDTLLALFEQVNRREPGLQDLREALNVATPFYLAPAALELIWHTDPRAPACPRLSYPVMAVEMDFSSSLTGKEPVYDPAEQRVMLAMEITPAIDEEGHVVAGYWLEEEHKEEPTALLVTALWKMDKPQPLHSFGSFQWAFSFYSAVIPFAALEEDNFGQWMGVEGGKVRFSTVSKDSPPRMPYLVKLVEQEIYPDGTTPGADVVDEIRTLIGLLNLLECSNVDTERIPAPKKLNRKRAKTGKLAIPEYLTLRLSPSERQVPTPSMGIPRLHASPRTHWRRGHIRRQRYGPKLEKVRSIWIEPMIVAAEEGEAGTPKILVK